MRAPLRWVVVPALITLGVTLLRLLAELRGWGATLANPEGGGRLALIGIAWLMFVVGGWFGHRLVRAGILPDQPGRTAARIALITVVGVGTGLALFAVLGRAALPGLMLANAVLYCAVAALVYRTWPELGRLNLVYALLARLPVIAITVPAVLNAWGTHYEKVGPGEGLELPAAEKIAWLSTAQLGMWVPWTVLFGGTTGAVVAWLAVRRGGRRATPGIDPRGWQESSMSSRSR